MAAVAKADEAVDRDISTVIEPESMERIPTPTIVYVLSAFGAIGGLLFGYDTGIVSGALPLIETSMGIDTESSSGDFTSEMIVSATCVFAIPGSLLGGVLTNQIGRKRTIISSAAIFCLGAAIISASSTVWMLITGRSILGIAIGLASQSVPMYIAEAAPPELRGQLTALFNFSCTFGQVIACITAGLLQHVPHGWRYMTGLAAAPALLQLIGMLFLPESPRWLVEKGRLEESLEVLKLLRGSEVAGKVEVEEINAEIKAAAAEARNLEGGDGMAKLAFRRALVVGCGLQAIQQLCGINTVMYYSSTILQEAGLSQSAAIWGAVIPASCNALMSFVALFLIEKLGRRILVLWSLTLVIVGLICLSGSFYVQAPGPVIILAMVLYILSFGLGLSPIPWTVNSEIYSLSYRSLGTSLSTTTNWGVNTVISLTFLSLTRALSTGDIPGPEGEPDQPNPAGAFTLYTVFAMLGFVFVYFMLPETQGRSLEQIQELFKGPVSRTETGSFIQ